MKTRIKLEMQQKPCQVGHFSLYLYVLNIFRELVIFKYSNLMEFKDARGWLRELEVTCFNGSIVLCGQSKFIQNVI